MGEIELIFFMPDMNEYRFPVQAWGATPAIGDRVRIVETGADGGEVEICTRAIEREWTFEGDNPPILWIALELLALDGSDLESDK